MDLDLHIDRFSDGVGTGQWFSDLDELQKPVHGQLCSNNKQSSPGRKEKTEERLANLGRSRSLCFEEDEARGRNVNSMSATRGVGSTL